MTSQLAYLLAPFAAYVAAGVLKLIVNSLRAGQIATDQIGLGGFPSTHNTITGTMVALVALREGITHPAFGVVLTLALIVAIDAMDLRNKVGRQARVLRRLAPRLDEAQALRTSVGHHPVEVAGGWLLGLAVAAALQEILPRLGAALG